MTRDEFAGRRVSAPITIGRIHVAFAMVTIAAMGLAAQADPEPTLQHQWLFDEDPGWSTEGEWAFGVPQGLGGEEFGNPDPTSGYTGDNVYGVNLYGDYSIDIGGPYYLTVGPIDMTGVTGSSMRFWRWLNTDWLPWVAAKIEVSNDYANWITLWENEWVEIADDAWNHWEFDIAAVADDQPTVWIRWSHEVLDGGTWAYSGWNLDDVEIWGATQPCAPGDLDCDEDVDLDDFQIIAVCLDGPGQSLAEGCGDADLDGDGDCDMGDIAAFQAAFGGL